MSIWDLANIPENRYKYMKWWRGKRCRLADSDAPFKVVVDLRFSGPPSMVYGDVVLIYEDGTEEQVFHPMGTFRPRKKDVEVESTKKGVR